MTRPAPSARFFATVRIVASTSCVRSSKVRITIPGGRVRRIWSRRASTAVATVRLFSPIRIRAVPMTVSRPFSLAEPVRRSRPIRTVAMSRIRTGTEPRLATTTSAIASGLSRRPAARPPRRR